VRSLLLRHDRRSVANLEERFYAAWSRSDELFSLIKEGEFLAQPIIWRHPFIFYLGHLPASSRLCELAR
jgi:hypothetical protein